MQYCAGLFVVQHCGACMHMCGAYLCIIVPVFTSEHTRVSTERARVEIKFMDYYQTMRHSWQKPIPKKHRDPNQ